MKSERTPNPKVLLIEDDTFLIGMYVKMIDQEHWQSVVATDGDRGLFFAKTEKPDCILLDIILPKMDGFLVLEELKRDPETRTIPVILLSNLGQTKDIDRGLSLGAADYLVKAHYLPSEVMERIKKVIRETRTARGLA